MWTVVESFFKLLVTSTSTLIPLRPRDTHLAFAGVGKAETRRGGCCCWSGGEGMALELKWYRAANACMCMCQHVLFLVGVVVAATTVAVVAASDLVVAIAVDVVVSAAGIDTLVVPNDVVVDVAVVTFVVIVAIVFVVYG